MDDVIFHSLFDLLAAVLKRRFRSFKGSQEELTGSVEGSLALDPQVALVLPDSTALSGNGRSRS